MYPPLPPLDAPLRVSIVYLLFLCYSEIPPPDCLKNGATLVFTVFDQDRMSDDDIHGEVYFDLQHAPGLNIDTLSGAFATAPQIEMPLIHGNLETGPFNGRQSFLTIIVFSSLLK